MTRNLIPVPALSYVAFQFAKHLCVCLTVLRVIVPQQQVESFVPAFVGAFQKSDWARYSNGDD